MPIDAPWLKGDPGPSSGDTYTTNADVVIPNGAHMHVEEYYEIGSGWATEISNPDGLLLISQPFFPKQFVQHTPVSDQNQTMDVNTEAWYQDSFEILNNVDVELALNSSLALGYPVYPGFRTGTDSSGGFIEIQAVGP